MAEVRVQVRTAHGDELDLTYAAFEDAVRAGSIGEDALLRIEAVTGGDFRRASELELYRSVVDDPRTRFERRFTLRRVPRATLATVALLVGVFVWQTRQPGSLDGAALVRQGAKSLPHQLELGQWWRLLTASLLHADWLHLVSNLAYMLYVGWSVESALGASGAVLLLLLSGLAAMALSTVATPAAAVGASGMAFGLFGAAVTLGWRYGGWIPHRVRVRYGWFMVPPVTWFVVVGWMWAYVDNFCHLGGLLAGGALGLALPSALEEDNRRARGWMRLTAAVLLAALVGFGGPLLWRAGLLGGAAVAASPASSEEAGWRLSSPSRWEPEEPTHAPSAWRSRTGHGRVSMAAWVEDDIPTPELVRQRWVAELEERAVVLPRSGPPASELGLGEGWFTLECDLVSGDRVWRSVRAGVVRGLYVTTIEFLHSDEHVDDYARLRRSVGESLSLQHPRPVVRAAEALVGRRLSGDELASVLPEAEARAASAPADGLRLGAELARLGEVDAARRVLAALGSDDAPEVRLWGLWIDLHLEQAPPPSLVDRAEALASSAPDSLPAAALTFDVMLAAGERERARAILDRMVDRWPQQQPTRQRRARLGP